MTNWQKYTVIIIPAIIVLFVLFWAWQRQEVIPPPDEGMVACTMEAKSCPDGSYVGRMVPSCEFAPCPGQGGMQRKSMDTSDWKTYHNEKYGYSIHYPESFTIFTDKNNKTETVTAPASNSTGVFLTDNKAHLFCCEPSLIRVEVFDTIITDLEKLAQEKGNLQTDNAYRVIKKGYEAFQGERAYRIYSSMGIDSPGNSIVFVHGNKTFFIQYNTDQSPFDDIIQSFQFIDTMQESWKTYRNEKYGFEVKYPSGSEKPVEITEGPFTGKYFRFGLLIGFQSTNFRINVYSNQSFDDRLQEVTKTYHVIDNAKDFSLGEIKGKEIGINWGEGGKGKFILWQRSDLIFETRVSVESYGNGKDVLDILSTFKFIK